MKKQMMTLAAAAAAFATLGTGVVAHANIDDPVILDRMETMKTLGGGMKTLTQMSKGEIDFDAAAANAALTSMAEAAQTVPAKFEANVVDPESDAADAIWENWDDFVTKAEALQSATTAAAGTVESADDLGPIMGSVGATCGGCHKPYKL